MNIKHLILLTGILMPARSLFAQYTEDALRFSQTEQGSTARMKALGTAQTAVGGDLGALASNPAGLGLFTKSELNFTPEFLNHNIKSNYLNTVTNSEKSKAGINELGIVIYSPKRKHKGENLSDGLLSVNFGASINKTNNFHSTIDYSGTNPRSSFADYLSDLANGSLLNGDPNTNQNALPSGSLEKMGYRNYLIEYDPEGYFPTTSTGNLQRNVVYHSGSQTEVNLGLASNIGNSLYLGASIGLASLNYEADREFTETGLNRTFPAQDPNIIGGKYTLGFRSSQLTEGAGLNLKLGLIYRASSALRVGFSFISPTWYSVTDTYSETLDTRYTKSNGTAYPPALTNDEEVYDTDYNLRTPYKANGGLAFTISKIALLTGDVEYVDYSSMKFSTASYELGRSTTRDIRERYKGAFNFKVGGEVKANVLAIRAGFNQTGNPYQNAESIVKTYSGGVGYRSGKFYLDLTYTKSDYSYTTRPYVIDESYNDFPFTGSGESASVKNTLNNIYTTIGFRF